MNVEWKETHVRNLYRVGHKGKVHIWLYVYACTHAIQVVDSFYVVFTFILWQVDLQCRVPGNGGYYYPDHLPVLGELTCACSKHTPCKYYFSVVLHV